MIKLNIDFKKEDFDGNGTVKISSLLKYMQDAACADAEQFGASRENLLSDNVFFAVYRNVLKIKNRITLDTKNATIVTFQSSHDRMRFIRNYFIYTDGKSWDEKSGASPYEDASVFCDSIWILMDTEKRTLVKANALSYPIEEFEIPFERPFKVITEKESMTSRGKFIGGDYYIDENCHVNNTAYADIVSDFSSIKNEIKYFDITYEHEILEKETVEILSQKSENGEKLLGVRLSDNAVCFCSEVRSII